MKEEDYELRLAAERKADAVERTAYRDYLAEEWEPAATIDDVDRDTSGGRDE
jgi:hypothetical protein